MMARVEDEVDSGAATAAGEEPSHPAPPEEKPAGLEVMGRGIRKLFNTVTDLRQLGIEGLEVPLPKIVVVGDQSAGKSSLIEALSEIKVPRSSGTCTRCPLEINLTDAAPGSAWSCEVRLQRGYEYTSDQSHHEGSRFERFRRLALPQDVLFRQVGRKEDLCDVLQKAQAEILAPATGGALRHTSTVSDLKFSPNIIRIHISGQGLPPLSFYDLPGVINQTENTDELHLVDLVKSLVHEYVDPKSCLVLLALSMDNELHNSTASGLIRLKMADDRCMGVLSKPDLLSHRKQWSTLRQVLENKIFPLKYGYFVTKQPDQTQLDEGITHREARALESAFFKTRAPWATEFSSFADRFGTRQLQVALSQQLARQYLLNLPDITATVRSKADSVEAQLMKLPDPPTDKLPLVLSRKLEHMNSAVQRSLGDLPTEHGVKDNWSALARAFSAFIHKSRPELLFDKDASKTHNKSETPKGSNVGAGDPVSPTPSRGRSGMAASVISLDSDDEEAPPSGIKSFGKRLADNGLSTPRKRQKPHATANVDWFGVPEDVAKTYSCSLVRSLLSRKDNNQLDNTAQAAVSVGIYRESMWHWKRPLDQFLKGTEEMLKGEICSIVDDIFAEYRQTELPGTIKAAVETVMAVAMGKARILADDCLANETNQHATLNTDGLNTARKQTRAALERRGLELAANMRLDQTENPNKTTTGKERDAKVSTMIERGDVSSHSFGRETQVLAEVQAWYRIAANRFVDLVYLALRRIVFGRIATALAVEVDGRLRLTEEDAQEHCAHLTAEDPNREKRRKYLKDKKARLNEALDRLARLAQS